MKKIIILLALFGTAVFAQQKGTFTDQRDKKTYKTVKIGTQTWMAENLDYGGKNGDIGSCYDKKAENCKKYGKLYDWGDAMAVCPFGWHLPSYDEWTQLTNFVGGGAGTKLKSTSGWNYVDKVEKSGNGTDKFGFSALPGGYGKSSGYFHFVGYNGYWWSSTEYSAYVAYLRYMDYDSANVDYDYDNAKYGYYSVRCVQD